MSCKINSNVKRIFKKKISTQYFTFVLGIVICILTIPTFGQLNSGKFDAVRIGEGTESYEWLKAWEAPKIPPDYTSPGNLHKIIIERAEPIQKRIIGKVRAENIYQYLNRSLYLISKTEFNKLTPAEKQRLNVRDDLNLIKLRDRFFDTSVPLPEVPAKLSLISEDTPQLHLVQFVGPIRDDWYSNLQDKQGLTIVDYYPENAYLVWADKSARNELTDWAELQPYIQWHGPLHPAYKIHPGFDLEYDGEVTATIQLFTHDDVGKSISAIKSLASEIIRNTYHTGKFTNIAVKIPASEIENIARLNDVINIEPWLKPQLFGEIQDQIVAGNINAARTGPNGPGYLAWLNGLGFNSNFEFAVDVTDDGFDQGETGSANVHEDFLDAAGNSRVVYVRRIVGTGVSTTDDEGCGGHGTINTAIVGGFNNTPAVDPDFDYYADGNNYHFGLGVAPYTLLGHSDIFHSGLAADYTTLIDTAYADGARISSNSWGLSCRFGCCGPGLLSTYDAGSQEYDGLVRDARPTSEAGNQEMVIVFAAGNEGNCPDEQLGNVGTTAKNTITVGAGENFNSTGDADGCGVGNNGANNIQDIADFSSRGPTIDGRVKPDIMAPGTHIYGAASQDACFTGISVCGDTDNDGALPPDDAYYPDDPDVTDARDQDLYTWSTGTSHSCPAVSGGCALVRQWFLNHGHPAPSPAMTKAYLMNTATHMTGVDANDDLPSSNQGMGLMNLGMAFDNTPRLLFDQVKTCYRNGAADASEIFTIQGQVADVTRPFRVTLAWTDAPGNPATGVIARNDLDLTVDVGGNLYRGNDFTLATSNILNPADPRDADNNVESVFLPAGTNGNFEITVNPAGINEDALDVSGAVINRQDFALVVYNGEFPGRNPVDIILVLDCSGSMRSIAAGGTMRKIDLLKEAAEIFIRAWEPYSIPDDRMGIILFSSTVTNPNAPDVLLPFQANADTLINQVRKISAGGCTSLGGGILTAYRGFDATPGHQKHIIVFSNGMQNCSPMVTGVGGAHQILNDPTPVCCNSGVAGEPGVNLADYNVKAIHTIGTGVLGASWISLLTNIANETGGENYFTSEPDELLEDFFLETLVNTLRIDPVEKIKTVKGIIAREDIQKTERFSLNSTVRQATFALTWKRGNANSLSFDLKDPNGITIPRSLMMIQSGSFYSFATVKFPLTVHGTPIDPAGVWEVVIRPGQTSVAGNYKVHLIVDDADIRYHFDQPSGNYAVGDIIPLSFWMQKGNQTLAGFSGEITVDVNRPPVGFGTILSNTKVSQADMDADIDLSGDSFANLASKKEHIILQDPAIRKRIAHRIDKIALYDDGRPNHGDVKAGDGVYSALYTDTQRPGYYNFNLTVSANDPRLGRIVRNETKTVSVGIKKFVISDSTITIKSLGQIDGRDTYLVNALPIDMYGNYLGPGYPVDVIIRPPGKVWGDSGRRVSLNDNLDGSYSGRVGFSKQEQQNGYILVLDIEGSTITRINPPSTRLKYGLSLHGGMATPTGDFADSFDPGVNFLVDAGYWINRNLAVMGFFGYNDFKSKITGVDDNYIINVSLNVRYYQPYRLLPSPPWSYYIGAGPGVYIPQDGDTEFGFNVGAGIDYEIRNNITLEIGADYHRTFDDVEFIHAHGGVIFRFGAF